MINDAPATRTTQHASRRLASTSRRPSAPRGTPATRPASTRPTPRRAPVPVPVVRCRPPRSPPPPSRPPSRRRRRTEKLNHLEVRDAGRFPDSTCPNHGTRIHTATLALALLRSLQRPCTTHRASSISAHRATIVLSCALRIVLLPTRSNLTPLRYHAPHPPSLIAFSLPNILTPHQAPRRQHRQVDRQRLIVRICG